MTTRDGKCMCGAVTFTAKGTGDTFGACHCKMCQRWAGSAMMALTVPEAGMEISGAEHVKRFQSSDWAERAWCDTCGSGLWYRITAPGPHSGDYHVPVGLFDDAAGLKLVREICVDRASGAFAYAGDLKRMTEAEVFAEFAP